MKKRRIVYRIISILLITVMLISMVGCNSTPPNTGLSDPTTQVITENIEEESIIEETILAENITEEIYLNEIVVAENKITELLLEEETITEVILCQTVYVPQENLEEFAENSQMAQLFGENVDIKGVLTKVAIGSGVIVTLAILQRAGLPQPVASIVVAAAEKSIQYAATGAGTGTLLGGLTGAFDSIDETGRTSAVIAFATATAGLIIAGVSLACEVHSLGTSTITAAIGIKLVISGVFVLAATAGTIKAGYDAIQTFKETDATDIDWSNIDWDAAGESAVKKSIEGAADGYMWGSIIGAVKGGAEGYQNYENHGAPYSTKKARIDQTPKDGERGNWTGVRGESDFVLKEPIKLEDGTIIKSITYKNGIPDFSKYAKAKVRIAAMTDVRRGKGNNFDQADEALAKLWSSIKQDGKSDWTARDVALHRDKYNLTWHEMNNMEYVQLVPTELNGTFGHLGGCGEYAAMIGGNTNGGFK